MTGRPSVALDLKTALPRNKSIGKWAELESNMGTSDYKSCVLTIRQANPQSNEFIETSW